MGKFFNLKLCQGAGFAVNSSAVSTDLSVKPVPTTENLPSP